MTDPFSQMGTEDPILGTEVFNALSLSLEDISFPGQQMKMKEITDFASKFEDGMQMIRMAMMKKPGSIPSIDHIYTYVSLQKKRLGLKGELGKIEEELGLYE